MHNKTVISLSRLHLSFKKLCGRLALLLISLGIFVGTACGIAAGSPTQTAENSSDPGPNPAAANSVPSASVPKPSRTVSKPADVQSLTGRDRVEVEAALGKPTGKLQSPEGALWLYAEWRGPCRRISPILERFVKSDPDIVLLKVDIVNWGTPVTRQFGINSVPNVLVFNRAKAQVGAATHDEEQIMQRVNQAKGSILRS